MIEESLELEAEPRLPPKGAFIALFGEDGAKLNPWRVLSGESTAEDA